MPTCRDCPKRSGSARYEQLLHMTGLGPFTRRLAGRLSGGMKQKLGLACTLVNPPRLLLLDEPTVGVDPVSRRELWQIVYRLVREERMSVLLSTAYLDEAERCDEVVLLHKGTVLGQGTPASFSDPMQGRTWRDRDRWRRQAPAAAATRTAAGRDRCGHRRGGGARGNDAVLRAAARRSAGRQRRRSGRSSSAALRGRVHRPAEINPRDGPRGRVDARPAAARSGR